MPNRRNEKTADARRNIGENCKNNHPSGGILFGQITVQDCKWKRDNLDNEQDAKQGKGIERFIS